MKRGNILLAAVIFCLSPAALGTSPDRPEVDAPRAAGVRGSGHTLKFLAVKSIVNLHNRRWNRVAVEARIGDDPDPEANRSLGERILKRGEVWTIRSQGEDVWYRSDADADHPDGCRTPWVHRPFYPNRSVTCNENL